MQSEYNSIRKKLFSDLNDAFIHVGLVVLLVMICLRIFSPFMGLMLWGLILAVVLYPLQQILAAKLNGRQGRAATLIVLSGLVLIGLPTILLGTSFSEFLHDKFEVVFSGTMTIDPPPASVAEWPVIGKTLSSLWAQASEDLPAFLVSIKPQLESLAKTVLGSLAHTASSLLKFLGSLIIAGIMMAYGKSGSAAVMKILTRLTSEEKGPSLHTLSTLTIRSVAMGVVGVAFLQSLVLGVGFVWVGIPAAGILALLVLLVGIAQLPALLITLPVIIYLWTTGDTSTIESVLQTIFLVIAGMSDGFLKPLLLGRGVEVPMPIILLGALGGMVSYGLIGLFLGSVILALGYQIFMDWVDNGNPEAQGDSAVSGE
ncbi:AI-2E family transporter [Planctomycetota bacterium]|nr:AI-2E family transporter [Planctomycetota bacterium]MDC3251953.1 AI-2E family transporter [Planctomycetota bacterium]